MVYVVTYVEIAVVPGAFEVTVCVVTKVEADCVLVTVIIWGDGVAGVAA